MPPVYESNGREDQGWVSGWVGGTRDHGRIGKTRQKEQARTIMVRFKRVHAHVRGSARGLNEKRAFG